MKIYVLGNTLIKKDATAVNLVPALQKELPQHEFLLVDPTESFNPDPDKTLIIIDTVLGIKKVQTYEDIDVFTKNKTVSVHDYDLILHLQLLKKLDKLPKKMVIIGVPQIRATASLVDQVIVLLAQ